MGGATEIHVSLPESFRTEWASLRVESQNLLLEGSCSATSVVLSVLQARMRESIVWSPTRALDLPSGDVRTLILKNVAGLSATDQTRLLAWIRRDGSATQIISTSERPLFTAVTRGMFEKALYYRLNVILLRIEPGGETKRASRPSGPIGATASLASSEHGGPSPREGNEAGPRLETRREPYRRR
jgi:sigma-54-interacting transcriptional regulator